MWNNLPQFTSCNDGDRIQSYVLWLKILLSFAISTTSRKVGNNFSLIQPKTFEAKTYAVVSQS
jgi:hypothetical protein